jgi:cell division septation protein DedD
MPVNWYAALVVIVLIGLVSVAVAKYHYNQNPPVIEPTTNTTWHAALAFDICGTTQPALAASPSTATTGLTTTGQGVLLIHPKDASEAGNNATVGKFADGYAGLTLTNTTLKFPSASVPLYKNGQKCGKGTPDAGKVGEVEARWWVITTKTENNQLVQTGGLTTVKPADLKFVNRQLITVGFVPDNVQLSKPPGTTITALLETLAGTQPVATTTSTAPSAATTTPTTSTPTTAASTTTTSPPSTTTTKPASTTTTK